jgi:hypothetical protein
MTWQLSFRFEENERSNRVASFVNSEIHGNGHQKAFVTSWVNAMALLPSTEDHTGADRRTLADVTFLSRCRVRLF